MKEKIAFPQLVELVAEKASTTNRMSELFLQELFANITQALSCGQSVKIKGLGSFKLAKDNTGKDIVFTPDIDLAETVNAPFAQFKPVELCDEISQEQLDEIDATMQPKTEKLEQNDDASLQHNLEKQPVSEPQPAPEPQTETEDEEPVAPVAEIVEATTQPPERSRKRLWIALAAVIAAIALITGLVLHKNSGQENEKLAQNDTIASQPTKIVIDTLRRDNSLHDMAQKHYGDRAFWVYIALENQQQFPDYHEIPKGTALIIPPAEKYGINSDSKQSLKNASQASSKLKKATRPKVEIIEEVVDEKVDKKVDEKVDKKDGKNDDEKEIGKEDKKKEEKVDKKELKKKLLSQETEDQTDDNDSTATTGRHSKKHHHLRHH